MARVRVVSLLILSLLAPAFLAACEEMGDAISKDGPIARVVADGGVTIYREEW